MGLHCRTKISKNLKKKQALPTQGGRLKKRAGLEWALAGSRTAGLSIKNRTFQRSGFLFVLVPLGDGQCVAAVVVGVIGMALDPMEGDLVDVQQVV